MPITDINARTHPITNTNIRYEGPCVAVGLLRMPYSLPPPGYSFIVSELAGHIGVWATRLYTWIERPSVYTASLRIKKSRRGGETLSASTRSNCGHNLQTSVGSETGGETEGSVYAGISLGLTY